MLTKQPIGSNRSVSASQASVVGKARSGLFFLLVFVFLLYTLFLSFPSLSLSFLTISTSIFAQMDFKTALALLVSFFVLFAVFGPRSKLDYLPSAPKQSGTLDPHQGPATGTEPNPSAHLNTPTPPMDSLDKQHDEKMIVNMIGTMIGIATFSLVLIWLFHLFNKLTTAKMHHRRSLQ